MSRKIPWPFVVVILTSFVLGAAWGWKLIQDRAAASGRLVSEAKLRILAPPGIFPRELLIEFQRREKIEVEVTHEHLPGSLLRRALKSAPGQYDLTIAYHYQVSALRAERKMVSPYDSRIKFPIAISPDFRKLPDDRNLMDTTPLLWGLLGVTGPKPSAPSKATFSVATWPSLAIGAEELTETPAAYASKLQSQVTSSDEFEKNLQFGPGGPALKLTAESIATPQLISHGSLEFGALKTALKTTRADSDFRGLSESGVRPLWILTAVTMVDGDLERTRKFLRFLLEPSNSIALVKHAQFGATTLRDTEDLATLPKSLRSSYFRTFPIDQILVEKDERVRLTDEVLEQLIRGAEVRNVVRATPTPRPTPKPVQVKKSLPPPSAPDESDGGSGRASDGAASPPADVTPAAQTPALDAPLEEADP